MRVSADGTHDDWRMGRNGFGADWDMAANDSVHLSAIEKHNNRKVPIVLGVIISMNVILSVHIGPHHERDNTTN